jgi:hypothetical protein
MSVASARIPVLVTPRQKAVIEQKARAAGVSVGEYLRRAAESFTPNDDEKALAGMIDQVLKTTTQASRAIDDALAFVEASNHRIAAMEKNKKAA